MALTELQNKVFEVTNPVEIDDACNNIRLLLADKLAWVSHPYNIAQRFIQRQEGSRGFILPKTYIKNTDDSTYKYHTLTPDNAYMGMFFFYVGSGIITDDEDVITWPVSIIFSVNLSLIDNNRLKNDGMFTQELIRDVRKTLKTGVYNFDFDYKVVKESRDLREVYREFSLNELEQYNTLPLQCFRLDLLLTLEEDC